MGIFKKKYKIHPTRYTKNKLFESYRSLQMNKSQEILKKYWGYDAFRTLQEDIIDAAIYGKDTVALMPTGGGKSICFQIPGLAREGVCLVISPLISLMQDQVDQLEAKGIRAKAITSMMSYREIDITLDNAKFEGLDFLYTSPERLQSRLFIERFKQMHVSLIVVDEAHCISEWGHDFRPPYRKIADLRKYHPEVPIIALTATATKEVKEDIILQLDLKNPAVFESSFQRVNLSYEVHQVENKDIALLKWVQKFPHMCGIVYCQTRKSVKEIANFLLNHGIKTGIYHGGLDATQRNQMMQLWMNNEVHLMIATNAFGMGIDKPNVRYVIHYEFPNNLEAYFQEAGRAGRDGKESRTLVLLNPRDITTTHEIVEKQFPPIQTVKSTYRALCNHLKLAIGSGEGESFPINLRELCNSFKLEVIETYQSLKILEMNGDILFNESVFNPTRIKFSVGNTVVYSFQIKYEKVAKLISFLSRSYPGIFDHFFDFDESVCCSKLGITAKELENQLHFLEQNGIIDITWKTDLPKVTFLHERLPDDYMRVSDEVYHNRKIRAFRRWDNMQQYLLTNHCREQFILHYFGQEVAPCGKCDYCRTIRKEKLAHAQIIARILSQLEVQAMSLDEIIVQNPTIQEVQIKHVLQQLILEEEVVFDGVYRLVLRD
jgi:ATP-dependent DNA helicase RecQ